MSAKKGKKAAPGVVGRWEYRCPRCKEIVPMYALNPMRIHGKYVEVCWDCKQQLTARKGADE